MVPNELHEELRGTWGPPPSDPSRRVIWEETMRLLSQVPQLLAETIKSEGTPFNSLLRDLGSLDALVAIEVECVECLLTRRNYETFDEVIQEITNSPRWTDILQDLSAVRKFRLRQRLGEEICNKLKFMLITNHEIRDWFFP